MDEFTSRMDELNHIKQKWVGIVASGKSTNRANIVNYMCIICETTQM